MGFDGYLVKVGSYNIPLSVIHADTYKCVRTIIDLDAYRDTNGVLHRNALDNIPYKIEFNLKPMYEKDLRPIMNSIRGNFTNALERKANVTFFDFETGEYVTQPMYMPDINYQIYGIWGNVIQYDATTLKFIGY